jgi:hypothetical protein
MRWFLRNRFAVSGVGITISIGWRHPVRLRLAVAILVRKTSRGIARKSMQVGGEARRAPGR